MMISVVIPVYNEKGAELNRVITLLRDIKSELASSFDTLRSVQEHWNS